ncbi:hypothetical protein DH2020_024581 [Rehmannia glutinosa]|uniref:ZZ-type domain-containing protein n=1 Tax=Rehmannia glutinosa TaxID=99300 RepID=A0ABR0W5Y2_REHGL
MEVSGEFERMKENESDDDDESEKFSEAFVCCVCRDLLYKPVVLEEEKDMGYFSPQINGPASQLQSEETIVKPLGVSQPCFSKADPSINPCSVRSGETMDTTQPVQSGSVHPETGFTNLLDREKILRQLVLPLLHIETQTRYIAMEHASRFQLMMSCVVPFRGLVFHIFFDLELICDPSPPPLYICPAFCVCCIVLQTNEMLKCEVCQSLHPGDIPKVCLEFDHFLEEQFPREYELRRGTLQMKQEQLSSEVPSTCSSEAGKESFHFSFSSGEDPLPWWNASSKVHIGVGCDSCGMYPIIGDRYRCKDCLEQIGYDLCKDCYTTSSKLPGRFNQQHTSDHKFEIVKSNAMHNIMLRLLRGQLQEVSAVSDALHDGAADVIPSSDNTNEDAENVVNPSSETETNLRENQRSA